MVRFCITKIKLKCNTQLHSFQSETSASSDSLYDQPPGHCFSASHLNAGGIIQFEKSVIKGR